MYICDTHCDTLCRILDDNSDLSNSAYDVNIRAVSDSEHYTQVFACFTDPEYGERAHERCMALIDTYYRQTDKFGIRRCVCSDDLHRARREARTASFLSIEGGECIRTIDDIEKLYGLGVRIAALTWNWDNHIAGGALENGDLTEFGRDIVKRMNGMGMIIDVSHLNRKSFYRIALISEKPLAATHSCSDFINPHPRNLTDEQFKIISSGGGYVGINFYPEFLTSGKTAEISDIIRHMAHFLDIGGEYTLGLGSDFDGIGSKPSDLKNAGGMRVLYERMVQEFGERQAKRIAYGNFERLLYNNGI